MISVFINSLTSGGAEKVVLTLLERFRVSGESLELVLIEKEQFYELPDQIPTKYLTDYETIENGFLKMSYLFVCAFRLKKLMTAPGQIVQSHLLRASFINVIAKLLGSKHHAQIVVHSRINFEQKPFYYRAIAKRIYTFIFQRADSVISICQTMKQELDHYLDLGKHPAHLAIYNPHNLQDIEQKAQEATLNFQFEPHKKYIVSVGRIVKGKRLDDLIKAYQLIETKHPETELIFIGDGDQRTLLEKQGEQFQLQHKIHFLGYQKNPFAYIAQSDILVLSSEWEGLPNILIEAMACGTAVISSDCISGPREILHPKSNLQTQLKNQIEHGEYGLLYPVGAVERLAEALELLLEDEALVSSFVQKGYDRSKDFDQTKIAAQYLESWPKKKILV